MISESIRNLLDFSVDPAGSGLVKAAPGASVAVALSGGVDSAVAAWVLKESGFRVSAFHLVLGAGETTVGPARETAERLGLDLKVLDLSAEFDRLVVGPFLRAYVAGRTPNPCAACNPAVKFGLLADRAAESGAAFLATGHYAAFGESGRLRRPRDRSKDQTYFLCRLRKPQLDRALFPLSGLDKAGVRRAAARIGLPERTESQDVCFLGGGDYRNYLLERLGPEVARVGDFIDRRGRVLGRHQGLIHYTVGQRRGLGLPGPEPYYVLALQPESGRVVLGVKSETQGRTLTADEVVWSGPVPDSPFHGRVQVRSRHRPAPAMVSLLDNDQALVEFDEPQESIAAGQAAAFYQGDELLGGGWILPATSDTRPPGPF